jgi:hypothetical protein
MRLKGMLSPPLGRHASLCWCRKPAARGLPMSVGVAESACVHPVMVWCCAGRAEPSQDALHGSPLLVQEALLGPVHGPLASHECQNSAVCMRSYNT